jgi:HlyD family secretion protein
VVHPVTRGSLRVTLDAAGQTRVRHRETVAAPASGRLLATTLEAGDAVRRGDPLFTLMAGRPDRARRLFVRAPLTGRVLRVLEPHERLIAAGTPLIELGNPRDLEVVVQLPDSDTAQVHDSLAVLVSGENSERIFPARVVRTDAIPGRGLSVTGEFAAAPDGFTDGSRVQASIVLWDGVDVLHIPRTALVQQRAGWQVFRVRGGRAQPVAVQVGHRGVTDAEIVSGLAAGDTVVSLPSAAIRKGTHVTGTVWNAGS